MFGDLIIVDFYPYPKIEPPADFLPFQEHIASELYRIFNDRFYIPQQSEFIKAQHTLPVTDKMREFARKQFRDENPNA